jgi:hypothetical protein
MDVEHRAGVRRRSARLGASRRAIAEYLGRLGVNRRSSVNTTIMSEKKISAVAAKAAEKARKERESERLGTAAVAESAKIRARFDDERQALARRYGVITGLS